MGDWSNIAKAKAAENENKAKLIEINSNLNDESGIYFLTRKDEEGFLYAYVGQAKKILTRLAQHLVGFQHIDLSIKKHGFYSEQNVFGWKVNFLNFPIEQLDAKEQEYIKKYALKGYQMRNKTSGSQGEGKKQIDDFRPGRGYRDGIIQGRKNASREIAGLFDKHLTVSAKNLVPTKNQEKALKKFQEFLEFYKEGSDGQAEQSRS
jgi:hypothetical protein